MKQISKEVLDERKRIKEKFSSLIEELREKRKLMVRSKSKFVVAITELNLLEKIFYWYVDNPDYKRTEKKRN